MQSEKQDTDTAKASHSYSYYDAAMKPCSQEQAKFAHVMTTNPDGTEESLWLERDQHDDPRQATNNDDR